jgi:low temperature requirement protein LtrA
MDHVKKKVEWIELFFDLVYVVAIASLTHTTIHLIEHDDVLQHYEVFIFLMAVVWWTWAGNTIYASRFKKGDAYYNILTGIQMGLVLIMSVFFENALGKDAQVFSLIYVAIRLVLLALYVRVHITEPDKRPVTGIFLSGFSLGGLMWLMACFLPVPYTLYLWIVGAVIDFLTPTLIRSKISEIAPANAEHLPERMGLLAIIILGESIVGVTAGLNGEMILHDYTLLLKLAVSFAAICAMWFSYFNILEKYIVHKVKGSGQELVRGHFFIYTGLGFFAELIHLFTRGHTLPCILLALLVVSLILVFAPLALVSWRYNYVKM